MKYIVSLIGAFLFGMLLASSLRVDGWFQGTAIVIGGIILLQIIFANLKAIRYEDKRKEDYNRYKKR